jgi:hypothetical protein
VRIPRHDQRLRLGCCGKSLDEGCQSMHPLFRQPVRSVMRHKREYMRTLLFCNLEQQIVFGGPVR